MQVHITYDMLPFSCSSSQDVHKKDHHHKEVDDETKSQDVIPENKWFSQSQSNFPPTTWRRRWSFQPCRHCYTGSGPPQPQGGSLHSRRNTVPNKQVLGINLRRRSPDSHWVQCRCGRSSSRQDRLWNYSTGPEKDHCCQSYTAIWLSLRTL